MNSEGFADFKAVKGQDWWTLDTGHWELDTGEWSVDRSSEERWKLDTESGVWRVHRQILNGKYRKVVYQLMVNREGRERGREILITL